MKTFPVTAEVEGPIEKCRASILFENFWHETVVVDTLSSEARFAVDRSSYGAVQAINLQVEKTYAFIGFLFDGELYITMCTVDVFQKKFCLRRVFKSCKYVIHISVIRVGFETCRTVPEESRLKMA